MIETFVLLLVTVPFVRRLYVDERRHQQAARDAKLNRPGLSSQHSQIKPLTPAQIALGKKAYLGPKRKRKVKIPKRHRKPVPPIPGN